MSEVNEAVIKKTQEVLGKFVKRPPLTDKLLMKPPFRFLHDVVNVVIKETGFLKGLYTADELKSDNIRDRDAKIKFLEKLINIVEMVTKEELKVRPSKIVAGQEVEKTNQLLQAIGMAIERKLDSKAAIEAAKAETAPKKSTKAPVQKVKPTAPVKAQKTTVKPEKTAAEKKVKPTEKVKEKPKSEEKGKPNAKAPKKDSVGQKNEKNKKDPDKKRIDSGIKLEDSPNEQDGKDSPKGIQLTLEATPKIDPEESPPVPEKVIEPKPVEKVEIVPEVAEKKVIQEVPKQRDELIDVIDEEAERRRKEKRPHKSRSHDEVPPPENVAETQETPRDEVEARAESHQRKRTKSTEKKVKKDVQKSKEITKQSSVDGSGKIQNVPRPKTSLRPPSVRPASARPGAPRRRDRNVEIVLQPEEMIKMGDISVKMENFSVDLEDDGENLIIIEDSTNREDPLPSAPLESVDGQEHGHLVQQILETQKGLTGGKVDEERKLDEWSGRTRQASTQQMDALREVIQKLTRAVNPLGKLMNFLQEDIDSMQREYNMWREMHQMALSELNRERSSTQPATDALKQLEASIVEHIELIDISRANILQNEQKIARLLTDT